MRSPGAVTHAQVMRFLELIDANMSIIDTDIEPYQRKRRGSDNSKPITVDMSRRHYDVVMPELSIAAAWVVVMKMAYGLDGKERCVRQERFSR